MENFNEILTQINAILWGWPMIILLIGTHLFLTIRLRFPQLRIFTAIRLSVTKENGYDGDVSPFAALATALAATIGTGNIVGVGTAIALGGPGAVFWCWITGVLGIATKYSEALLAIKYRKVTSDGKMLGGPMYALKSGMNWRVGAFLFAFFTMIASFGIGCSVQSNAICTLAAEAYNIDEWIWGMGVCLLSAAVILGGVKSIAKVCTTLVPIMALFYVLGCITILCFNSAYLLPAVKLILSSAFSTEASVGGFAGATIMMAARYGIARGLFSNESGLGSAPIVAAAAQTRNPVRQALVSSSGTFWDTVVICAMTGLVIVSSVLANPEITWSNGGTLTQMAFNQIPIIGKPVLTFGLITFSFSTILGWCYYGERASEYIGGKRAILPYRIVFLFVIFIASGISLNTVWELADIFNALMAIPNLIALLALNGIIVHETRKFLWRGRLDKEG